MSNNIPTDDSAFLRAIAADPDDDAPRLVYADFLEESGDPSRRARAELIRFQVAAAREGPDDPKAGEAMPEAIARTWVPVWEYALPNLANCDWGPYRRGFIDEVRITFRAFRRSREAILTAIPLRRLRLRGAESLDEDSVAVLVGNNDFPTVPDIEITFAPWLAGIVMGVLAAAGPWPGLRRMTLDVDELEIVESQGEVPEWREQAHDLLPILRDRFGHLLELSPELSAEL